MVRPRRTEDRDHPGQRSLGAGPHVQRFDRQPLRIHPDQLSNSRSQTPQDAALDICQLPPKSGQFVFGIFRPVRAWGGGGCFRRNQATRAELNRTGAAMGRRRFEMFQYRQVLERLRAGDSERDIDRSGLMGRE